MKEIDRYKLIFLILSLAFIILFIVGSLIRHPIPNRSGVYRVLLITYIYGGWEGIILILVSMIKVIKGNEKVNSAFKLYIVGIALIIINLVLLWPYYLLVGYILSVISLIGFTIAIIVLNKIKPLASQQLLTQEPKPKEDELTEEAVLIKKKFEKQSLTSIIIFLISAFVPYPAGEGFMFFGYGYYIFGGWLGFVFILISFILVHSDFKKMIGTAFYLYLIGVILIGINALFLFLGRALFQATIPIIILFISLILFIVSLSTLAKTKREVLSMTQIY